MRRLFTFLFAFFFAYSLNAQTTLFTEDFNDATQYTVTLGGEGNDGTADYFQRTDGTNINISYSSYNGTYFFAGQDIDDGGWTGSASPSELTWSNIDISGYSDLQFSGLFASAATAKIDDNDYIHVQYRIDGGAWTDLIWFENDGTQYNTYFLEDTDFNGDGDGTQLTSTFAEFTKNISVTGSSLDLRITVVVNSGGEDFAIDYFRILGTAAGSVADPSNFSASAGGSDNIDLSWDKNSNGDNVMVAYNITNTFGTPTDGTIYSSGDVISGGGIVIYNGSAVSYNHSGLTSNTTYYYKAWSLDGSISYSSGIETNATTAKEEPTNHVSNFTASANGSNKIDLSWTENDGAVVPDGYLIKCSTGSITDPVDGTEESDDTDLSDGNGEVNVSHGDTTYTWSGLSASTTYNFKIYPYTNSGSHIDYKTDGTVPSANATTEAASPEYLIISEVSDPGDNYNARFVEIVNIGSSDIDLTAGSYYLSKQSNGGTFADAQLTGTIAAGDVITVAYSQTEFNSAYGFDPDFSNGNINGNGDDGYFLYKGGDHSSGTLIDAYGVIDVDGSGEAWEYTDSRAYRKSTVTQANATWTADEWVIESANVDDMTPGNYPEVDASTTFDGVAEHDFVTSDHAAVKVKINSITGSGTFSVKYYEGRGPKHATGITESNIGNFGWYFEMDAAITAINVDLKFYLSDLPDGSITEGASELKLYKRETFGTGDFGLVGTLTYYDNGTPGDQSDDWLEYDGITGFSEYAVAGNTGLSPVELSMFTASVNGNSVTLNWQTATEVNNYGFEIERNGKKIGFVEGAGNSNSPKEYSFTDNVVASGRYSYRLKQIDLDGAYEYSNVVEVEVGVPSKFELSQNYPNPFNPTTTIKYSVAKEQTVTLKIYDMLGREVMTLVNGKQAHGNYEVKFDASELTSGVYFYSLQSGSFKATKKMILMK